MKLSKDQLLIFILIVSGIKSEDLSSGSKCQTNDGIEGNCVVIDSCNILRDKLRNGTIRTSQVTVCNNQMRYICCPVDSSFLSSRLNLAKLSSWNLIEDGPSTCGKAVIEFGNVFYGTQIERGAFPWIAALYTTKDNKFFCGGTIVSKRIVVTAAHCMEGKQKQHVFDSKDIFVILGAHNLETPLEPGRLILSVNSIHVHHDWNPYVSSFDADIAILKLASDVHFNEYIQPICIAAPKSEAAIKTLGIVVGFGRSEHREVENIARLITSPIHSHQLCSNSSRHESLLTHRTFCGGFPNGTNVCKGDSGSGLIVNYNGIYYLRGIVSSALHDPLIGCNINSYSVFTDTLEFYSWITTGKDDKILLQTTLEENRKLKLENAKYVRIIQELREENRRFKEQTSTTIGTPTTKASTTTDPTFGGLFSTHKPYVDPDEYVQPENKQDQFDWKLTREVIKSQPGNILISPLGAKVLLTLLAEAEGQTIKSKTRTELEQVLPYNKNLYDAKEYFKKVLASISTLDDAYRVNFATRIFVDGIVNINQRFSSIAEHNYNADVTNLEFNDARNSAKTINDWVKDVTRGNIKDLVSEDAFQKSILVLINALYFEGTWRFPFNKTISRDFISAPGRKSAKKFMEQTSNFYYFYSRHLNSKILRLPYEGRRFSMFIILPSDINGIDAVVDKLESNALKNEVWLMDELETHVVIPKFKFDTSVNLNDITKALGISEIFENSVTFPLLARGGNTDGKLKVSNIIQKSGISVDEKGTIAYAATEIELVNEFGGEPKEFIADRPFVFYIEDDTTGAKLFAGRVSNPEY